MRAEVEDPSPAVPAEVSPDTDWMAADPEPDSRPGLRGIVRIAKLRPSALVSVLFAARQRDPQQLRDFFLEIQHGFKLLENRGFELRSLSGLEGVANESGVRSTILLLSGMLLVSLVPASLALEASQAGMEPPKLRVLLGKSLIVNSDEPLRRVSPCRTPGLRRL